MSDKKVFINRYSSDGAKIWSKQIGDVSDWAIKIDQNGNVLKAATKISDTLRLMRGNEPVNLKGKAAFFTGDVLS